MALALAVAGLFVLREMRGVPGWSQRVSAIEPTGVTRAQLLAQMGSSDRALPVQAYEDLFKYLLEGFVNYRSPIGARVYLPGAGSEHGRDADGLEGFMRFIPLASAWLGSGRAERVGIGNRQIDLSQLLIDGIVAGTDPNSPEYWGALRDYDQAAYEAGDLATALWLSRGQVWSRLTPAQREQVAAWMRQVLDVKVYAGNWSLSPLLVYASLRALGQDVHRHDERAKTMFERFKTSYKGAGWFDDPPSGFDYYNSWAIHYNLFWLSRMDPGFETGFIREAQTEFATFFKHFFGPHGVPMFGRSVCYRMGASAGLLTASAMAPDAVAPGVAMRALDTSTRFFVSHGSVAGGTVTQGFCGPDLSVIDIYSGQGSCQMGLRALVVAFFLDPSMRVFETPRRPLPVENGDFSLHNPVTNWTISGRRDDGHVTLTIDGNPADAQIPLQPYTLRQQLTEMLLLKPRRPDNHHALYSSRRYSTADFGVACPRAGS
ncbi:MAG: DUF2264 domain-containing protein [Burkholderiaceae bacterium]